MKFAAILLWLFAAPQALLTDGLYQVPAGDWRYVEPFVIKQMPVAVDCSFQVVPGGPSVQIELVARPELDRLLASKPHRALASTGFGSNGQLALPVRTPGEYALVVVGGKDARGIASVHLRLSLDFSGNTGPVAGYLTPRRRWTVIGISLAAFFAIVIVSARKLLHAMKNG